jgi:hypothetical protein
MRERRDGGVIMLLGVMPGTAAVLAGISLGGHR